MYKKKKEKKKYKICTSIINVSVRRLGKRQPWHCMWVLHTLLQIFTYKVNLTDNRSDKYIINI